MPKPNYVDGVPGNRRMVSSSIRQSAVLLASSGGNPYKSNNNDESKGRDAAAVEADLSQWEERLSEEVDEDLFEDPRSFQTLQRVIDVLGLQLMDDAASVHSGFTAAGSVLGSNPAYRDLKRQQEVVEQAIEHMAMMYCSDLNGSVIKVGQVARRFNEAVSTVRSLRRQVKDIQDTIGATTGQRGNAKGSMAAREAAANAMSLRELWLKKLECESILSLLNKLDVIRAAPSRFDYLIQPPCRIGAAVLSLSHALATMFSDDVAQVRYLTPAGCKNIHSSLSFFWFH